MDPGDVQVHETVRFEGDTNPADQDIVLAIGCSSGCKGVYSVPTEGMIPTATPTLTGAGVPKIMSGWLGHATTAFTQDVYMKSTDPLGRWRESKMLTPPGRDSQGSRRVRRWQRSMCWWLVVGRQASLR